MGAADGKSLPFVCSVVVRGQPFRAAWQLRAADGTVVAHGEDNTEAFPSISTAIRHAFALYQCYEAAMEPPCPPGDEPDIQRSVVDRCGG
jgi:hypothetical protein